MYIIHGLLQWVSNKEVTYNAGDVACKSGVWSLDQEDPLEKKMATHSSIAAAAAAKWLQSCPTLCDPMDRGAWQATVCGVAKESVYDLETKQQKQQIQYITYIQNTAHILNI